MHQPTLLSLLTTSLLASVSLAQSANASPTISVLILDAGHQPLVASVVTANAATTSLAINCPKGEDPNRCGFAPGIGVERISSSIWAASISEGKAFTMSYRCEVNEKATCTTSVGGSEANFPGTTSVTVPAAKMPYLPVTITAGQEKLAAATSAATSTSSSPGNAGERVQAGTVGLGLGSVMAMGLNWFL